MSAGREQDGAGPGQRRMPVAQRGRLRRVGAVLLPLALVAATCADSATTPDAGEDPDPSLAGGGGDLAEPADLAELGIPLVTGVEVEPPIAAPGSAVTVRVAGHAPGADVALVHGDREQVAPLGGDGSAELELPQDAPTGAYQVRVVVDGLVVGIGQVRVADGPSIWLRADRRTAGEHDQVTLTVTSMGLPPDVPALLVAPPEAAAYDDPDDPDDWDDWDDWEDRDDAWLGDGAGDGDPDDWDWEDWDDFDIGEWRERILEQPEGVEELDPFGDPDDEWMALFAAHPSGAVVPHQLAELAAGRYPTLAELTAGPLVVPGFLAELGGFRVLAALDADVTPGIEDVEVVWSNPVRLDACGEPGVVSGQVSRPSLVRAVSVATGPTVASVETAGAYQLEAGPGPVVVSVVPLDAFDAGVGDGPGAVEREVVEVGCGATATLTSAVPDAPGVVRTASPGGSGVVVTAASTGASRWQEPAEADVVRPVQSSGGGRSVCRRAVVMPSVTGQDVEPWAARLLGEVLAKHVDDALPRLTVIHPDDIGALLSLQAQRQLLGEEDDDLSELAGALDADLLLSINVGRVGAQYVMVLTSIRVADGRVVARRHMTADRADELFHTPLYRELALASQRSLICGEVEPTDHSLEPRGTTEFALRVTDLRAEGVDGAEVELLADPSCGTLHPGEGQRRTEEGSLTLTFEAHVPDHETCVDRLRMRVRWPDGAPQPVETVVPEVGPDVRVQVGGRYRVQMDFSLAQESVLAAAPVVFGGRIELEAYNCEYGGVLGPWSGVVDAEAAFAAPFLGAAEGGQQLPVDFTLPAGGGSFVPVGIEHLGLHGQYYAGVDYVVLTSQGVPMLVGQIEILGEDDPCG